MRSNKIKMQKNENYKLPTTNYKLAHKPVLLNEVIGALDLRPNMFVIDGTVDGGGHAEAILRKIGSKGKLLGLDLDPELLAKCRVKLKDFPNADLRQGNYADLPVVLQEAGLAKADALLLDLGFSSEQLESGKGFAFTKDEPLKMTYSPGAKPISELLRNMSETELTEVIRNLGEERFAPKIARAIYSRERRSPLTMTGELTALIRETVPGNYEHGRLNPATRTFQALRIYANDELGNLKRLLASLSFLLARDGKVAIISFQSLEDRIVKHGFREMEKQGTLRILTKKPITAGEEEIKENPRARSAKLRVAEIS